MQRKPGYPVANCSIKMPDGISIPEASVHEEDNEQQQRRLQLVNFGHSQWGFNNWNWAVTKQELDFVELTNGKYCAGVVAFVSVSVKNLDIHRENIGYATSNANTKGFAIYKSRKCAVTNALRETLLSFGGSVATELLELQEHKSELQTPAPPPEQTQENNQNLANKPSEPKNSINNLKNIRKDSTGTANSINSPLPVRNTPVANAPVPVAKANPIPANPIPANPIPANPIPANPIPANPIPANPIPANLPPAANRAPVPRAPPPHPRHGSNEKLEGLTEEEARAERRRRQRLAQEEFRLKQLQKNGTDDKQELNKNTSSLDKLLMEIPTQDIVIDETGASAQADAIAEAGKRKSPAPEGNCAKRRASYSRLDIVQTD